MSSGEAGFRVVLVVPCYNEAERFPGEAFSAILADPRIHLVFVDDGSRDATARVLEDWCAEANGRAELIRSPVNCGKGEAVRAGMRHALASGAAVVGYTDADLATPVDELLRMVDVLGESRVDAVIGSRIALLGLDIDRRAARHHLGRIFATCVSFVLRERVYDSQCGAKFFRANDTLRAVVAEPFLSRWAFDVELLGRLLVTGARIVEVPLRRWTDVPGTKLHPLAMARAAADLVRIELELRRWRARPRDGVTEGVDSGEQQDPRSAKRVEREGEDRA